MPEYSPGQRTYWADVREIARGTKGSYSLQELCTIFREQQDKGSYTEEQLEGIAHFIRHLTLRQAPK